MKKFWVKRKRACTLLSAAALLLAALSGCGAKSSTRESSMDMAAQAPAAGVYENAYVAEAAAEEMEMDGAATGGQEASEVPEAATGRKLIKEVSMDVETEQYDRLLADITAKVEALGGYIESSYTSGNSHDYAGDPSARRKYGELQARIPQQRLKEFITAVEGASNVVSKRENVQDVTLQYVDLESHKKALLVEQERLLALLERAETVEDIITIESRLSEVRYRLESMESQLRTFDNKIDYSTVSLNISEVVRLTPVTAGETGVWERIAKGFSENLYRLGHGLSEFGIGLLVNMPYILAWIVFFLLAALLVFAVVRSARRRANKKAARGSGGQRQNATQQAMTAAWQTQDSARTEDAVQQQTDAQTPQEQQKKTGDTDGKSI